MITIRRILFPTDFSECAEHAYVHAAHLARRFGATLHVLNVLKPHEEDPNNPMNFFPLERDVPPSIAPREREVEELPVVRAQVRDASPVTGILGYADAHDIDLIVMGTHGRKGVDRMVIGSVAEEVIRLATCPVLTVWAEAEAVPTPAVQRILVPVDFSPHAMLSITYAKELAAAYSAVLDLLHVVPEEVVPAVYEARPSMTDVEAARQQAQEALAAQAANSPGADVPVHCTARVGQPAHEIVAFAEQEGVDLVVIATHGNTGLKRLLLGSVTEKVVRAAPCPVFAVKSYGKSLITAHQRAAQAREKA